MRGKIALTVGDTDVTRLARGLSFSTAAMGGYDTLSVQIMLPPEALDLTPATRVRVTDTRSGQVVWSGFVSSPGDQETDARRVDLTAVGLRRVAEDRTARMLYIDRTLEQWQEAPTGNRPNSSAGAGQMPDTAGVLAGAPAAVVAIPPGQAIGSSQGVAALYYGGVDTPQMIGGVVFARDEALTSSDWEVSWSVAQYASLDAGFVIGVHTRTLSHSATSLRLYRGSGTWPEWAIQPVLRWSLYRVGAATNVAGEGVWAGMAYPCVLGQMVDRHGTALNMGWAANVNVLDPWPTKADPIVAYVTANRVLEDMIGRGLLGDVDVAGAIIEPSTVPIPQLAHADPARPGEVLDELVQLDSSMLWRIDEGAAGRPRPVLRKWPTTVRYVLDDRDSYVRRGQEFAQANRVIVSYADQYGRPRTEIATFPVPALDDAGLEVYAEPLTLPDGLTGSAANALQYGTETLRDLYNQPASGTALVGRRIFDYQSGGWVEPWEIEPGSLVQIARTGDVIRLNAVEWDDDNYTARLTLGNPGRSAEERMAAVTGGRAR